MSRTRERVRAPRKPLKGFVTLNFDDGRPLIEGVLTDVSVTGLAFLTKLDPAAGFSNGVAEVLLRIPGWPDFVAYGSMARRERRPVGQLVALSFISLPRELYDHLKAHTLK